VDWVLIGVAGAAGAVARHLVGTWIGRLPGGRAFPWGTLVVNTAGSFLLGLVTGLFVGRGALAPEVKAVLGTGFLGAFTTFSTWSVDTVLLLEAGRWLPAAANVAFSLALGLVAVWAGHRLGQAA